MIVLTSRVGPDAGWLTDPAWAGGIMVRPLGELTAAESDELLELRDVDPDFRKSIVNFAGGHPFVLSLAAEACASMMIASEFTREKAVRWVISAALDRLVGPVPSPVHRAALEVCAHAWTTTLALLRRAVPGGPAEELFEWLRQSSYVTSSGGGLRVFRVVRKLLAADLRWRNPEGYVDLHRRLRDYTLDKQLRNAAGGTRRCRRCGRTRTWPATVACCRTTCRLPETKTSSPARRGPRSTSC
ncbi:hypothetical protein ACWEOE_08765 [Amycolatopsis sp. NPDC004368]